MSDDVVIGPTGEAEPAPRLPVHQSAFGAFVDGLNGLGSLIIAIDMLLICADVLSRALFNRPLPGVSELVATSIVVIVFLSLASTLRHGRMSRADLFIDDLVVRRPRVGRWLEAAYHLLGAIACGLLAWSAVRPLIRAVERGEFMGTEGVFTAPVWPMFAAVVVGGAIAAVQFLLLARAHLQRGPEDAQSPGA